MGMKEREIPEMGNGFYMLGKLGCPDEKGERGDMGGVGCLAESSE